MINSSNVLDILTDSPSVGLLKLKNREIIISFFIDLFPNQQGAISSEQIQRKLADYLEYREVESDEESGIETSDAYEVKAKKYIRQWTDRGFLTNYQNERGEIHYELSSHSSKTLYWLSSLKKKEYVGTESKFKNIFNQLQELVEYTNEDVKKRIRLLKKKRKEIDKQIKDLEAGKDIKIFEDFEIVPRFNQINQSAKELLSDFKEVEDNFKDITKSIYQKHADTSLNKSHILDFTFDSLDELKESQQGKSFYAFWSFLLNPALQEDWMKLVTELYNTLESKNITIDDFFLKGIKKHLHFAGRKVYKANDKMAEKLSRIIGENERNNSILTKSTVQEIKTLLIALSKKKQKKKTRISFELEMSTEINMPFERRLTFESKEEVTYGDQPKLADGDLLESEYLGKLFKQRLIDKAILKKRIKNVLNKKSQTTLLEVIELNNGVQNGLPELFGYLSVVKEFKHTINDKKSQRIVFDTANQKLIQIPEIIITR